MLRTFSIQTLGCRVNQYEGEQLAAVLRARGLTQTDPPHADLRVVNTCSVTMQAAGKSRQLTRRATAAPPGTSIPGPPARRLSLRQLPVQLPVGPTPVGPESVGSASPSAATTGGGFGGADGLGGGGAVTAILGPAIAGSPTGFPADFPSASGPLSGPASPRRPRVVVTGCWATSDRQAAAALPGVDAVVGHHDDVNAELTRLLTLWQDGEETAGPHPAVIAGQLPGRNEPARPADPTPSGAVGGVRQILLPEVAPKPSGDDGWINYVGQAGSSAGDLTPANKPFARADVNAKFDAAAGDGAGASRPNRAAGTTSLPLLGGRQTGRQRAYLKVQDGCDAHCTYCIIPRLRPAPWSKPVPAAVEEANRLVAAGHVELVLTGIFLGAYGQPTALRRRQPFETGGPLAALVDALCAGVPGLRRLRLSSLEPGDLTPDLLAALRSHPQVVPHFHLPLQSGSDALLRRMNRQYTRGDFLRMVDQVRAAFDRPALTTDVIVGFPGETDAEFARSLEVVDAAAFIHVHAFSYSPRPGTAAARWTRQFVRGPVVNERIETLRARATEHSLAFRRQFLGETVELLVEMEKEEGEGRDDLTAGLHHGRCERYFPVYFEDPTTAPGDFVRVRVERVSPNRTFGTRV